MLIVALLIVAATIILMARRVEVRLVLLGAGLLMALVAGTPLAIADTFTRAMVATMVAPICAAMGFAAIVTVTGCDRHLVHLLLAPIRRAPYLTLPGGVLAAYLVNMAISSQTSTAAALGPILVPLMLGSGYSPTVAGAALLLGSSFGGDLLNPGAQDVQSIAGITSISAPDLSARVIPASIAGAITAAVIFTLLYARAKRTADDTPPAIDEAAPFRINLFRAAIPLVPIALLLAGYAGVPQLHWLIAPPPGTEWTVLAGALPVVRAMLIGSVLAALVAFREIPGLVSILFQGMGNAYASIISLTIAAQCFGAGIAVIGLSAALLDAATKTGALSLLALGFPWTLSVLSGSGSGPILAFSQTFLARMEPGQSSVTLAALACFGGAFGRTISPVAAVVVYTSGLVAVSPVLIIRTVLPALLAGAAVAIALVLR